MKLTHTFIFFFFASIGLMGQTHNEYHQTLVNQVSSTSIETNLTSFVNFGVKEQGSSSQQNALNWLVNLYQSWGYTTIEQQAVNAWGETGYNLIVTKTGTVYPNSYIIVDGHYDTINGPGANDNGSGTAIILEMARILKDIPTEYSIKFIHFTGEELGLIGSTKYVEDIAVPQNLDIKLVLNIDQVGGIAGEVNNTITCEQDEEWPNSNNNASAIATNQLMNLMELYSNLNTHLDRAYGSDYVPFQEEGYVITGLYEYNESPYPHSSQDTLQNLDFAFIEQVAKGSLGAVCFFAKAFQEMSVNDQNTVGLKISPNPADAYLRIQHSLKGNLAIKLVDLSGKTILSQIYSEKEFQLNTSQIPNGVYLLQYSNGEINSSQKIIVQH